MQFFLWQILHSKKIRRSKSDDDLRVYKCCGRGFVVEADTSAEFLLLSPMI
jgi:hypothetical protein